MADEVAKAGDDTDGPKGWWVLWPILVPLGFGTPAGFLYAAFRSGARRWYAWALMWAVLVAAGVVLSEVGPEDGALDTGGSLFLFAVWFGGAAHALAARPEYVRRISDPQHDHVGAARSRLEQRARARSLHAPIPSWPVSWASGGPICPAPRRWGWST